MMMGLGAVASMLLAIPVDGGLFDLRLSLMAIAGFFGGPIAGATAAAIAIAYRLGVVGGPTGVSAVSAIAAAATLGWLVSVTTRRRIPAMLTLLVLAAAVAGVNFGISAGLRGTAAATAPLTLQVILMNAVATGLSGFFMMRYRVVERERDLLRQAFLNSPDFQYVKDPEGSFVSVNRNAARHNGFDTPAAMTGKTDFDLTDPVRARRLMEAEQAVMAGGPPIVDQEELVAGANGEKVWYLTSKVALHDEMGRIIGLAGVSRDVTIRRRLRDEAEEASKRLDFVLGNMSDGIALFDRFGILVYCNEQYRGMFALTREVREPGRHINEILRAVAMVGEQVGIPEGAEDEWVEQVAATLGVDGDQEIRLSNGRWLQIKTRPTSDGQSLIVLSDITSLKNAETALRQMAEQLRLLASTDGLTGLPNRRAFDQTLEAEMSRAGRSESPLSLLLVDVDMFKSYNDLYGHQAGDAALKTAALCLQQSLRRPGDLAARYGGEEFGVILPDTDETGAMVIADTFRDELRRLGVLHGGSEKGVLTASVGVATLERTSGSDAGVLLRRADEALYRAKNTGRDRTIAWRAIGLASQQTG
jgi:diguanylate cyclase (GGDEF)-like protein/PAS domain S-box-containing protein